ncbi:hypothetical protein ASPBRDRAFT_331269 [Aspergillus brasiliensis CBS 101740]|uniref:Uncharacterized protein n=1 Tax=Aspergillus brasiliensis (strain CBS 101740 / IMI 381727 / IBT 21946) TaxID=767769 RepID=A0A1L9U8P2_ASPBC|nr:hypothetical protein ASPBRDRAFT_331269 [Aspergillus brasiliensis CBS 101740]
MKRSAEYAFSANDPGDKQIRPSQDLTPDTSLPLTEEYLAQFDMASGVNPVFPAPSITSTSRSRSSSPQKLSESTYRSRTLSRAGIYVDVNVPEGVRDRINIALETPTANAATLRDLASKLQQKSMKLTAAQAGEADRTSLLHDIVEQLMPSNLLLAQNRGIKILLYTSSHQLRN